MSNRHSNIVQLLTKSTPIQQIHPYLGLTSSLRKLTERLTAQSWVTPYQHQRLQHYCTSGQANGEPRGIVTYPKNSPDNKPRFLPLWNAAYETLQFPLLMLHGKAGWSRGSPSEHPPFKCRTMEYSKH